MLDSTSRRQVLGAAVASLALPLLAKLPTAEAAADGGTWIAAGKVADLADGGYLVVEGQPIVLARTGSSVVALSTKCTHKGCAVSPVKTRAGVLKCKCHGAEFDLNGDVTRAPAKEGLPRYAVRIKEGAIEVNLGMKLAADDATGVATIG